MIMCAMRWNFTPKHIDALLEMARHYEANIRINPLKPTLPEHMDIALDPQMYYQGFARLLKSCQPVDLGEPPLAAVTNFARAKRCPCGRTSFRIHSVSPTGEIYVSPCVYLHDYKAPLDLLTNNLIDIINSPQFRAFRQRNANPEMIEGCRGCEMLTSCGGGCAGRSFLYKLHTSGVKSLLARDPYCPKRVGPSAVFPQEPVIDDSRRLVHMDYLCTWIGRPL